MLSVKVGILASEIMETSGAKAMPHQVIMIALSCR